MALSILFVVIAVTLGALDVVRAVVTSHRASAAADLAALAGAAQLADGWAVAQACSQAARVARANGSSLSDCSSSADGSLVVVVTAASDRPWPQRATARSRAGVLPGS